jgi:eukaryotic-like serine/threonine-protein kinase
MMGDPGEAMKVLDRYLLYGKIAAGGQAVVHFGQFIGPKGFTRAVAIKRLLPQFAADPRSAAMLLDEARLAARIRHPNVVSMLDVGQTDGEIFLVMEYVSGESLANLMRLSRSSGVSMPPEISVAVLAGVLVGLHAAHEARSDQGEPLEIVHRDVSPQNVMVGPDGTARVLDFGVARAAVRSGQTQEGEIKGKLRYMAPEHLRGEVVDRRADIYAASVVLWELLTGQKFMNADDVELYGRILEGQVQPPSKLAAIPPELDAVVLRGLSRGPAERYATALAMAEALEAALRPASARQVGAWVEQVAGPQLAERARIVAAMELMGRQFLTPSTPSFGEEESAPPAVVSSRSIPVLREITSERQGIALSKGEHAAARDSPTENLITETATHVRDLGRTRSSSQSESLNSPSENSPSEKTLASEGTRPAPASSALSRVPLVAVLIGLVAALALVGLAAVPGAKAQVLSHGLGEVVRRGERRAAEGARSALVAAPSPAVVASATPSTPPNASASSAADLGAASTPSAPRAATPLAPRAKPTRVKSPCDPPFYTDETGIRRIKRECL